MEPRAFDNNQDKLERYFTTRSPALRNEIALDNQELVWFIVKRYTSAVATKEDMFQAGMIGLIIAIDRFDPAHGVKLSTYAVPYIQNEIRQLIDNPDYIEDHVGLEAVDDHEENPLREKLESLYASLLTSGERTILDIILRTNDEPAWSVNDIARETHLTSRQVRELYASGVEKLNQPWVRWYIKQIENLL